METVKKKNGQTRFNLKRYFRNGSVPTGSHFEVLIDSMINKKDDGFSKDIDHGLVVAPMEDSKKYISYFESVDSKSPSWLMTKGPKDERDLVLTTGSNQFNLSMGGDGRIGIGKKEPKYELDVSGFIGMPGMIGTYSAGEIPADGKFHDVLQELEGCQAYEIIARTGDKGNGKYALLHALALAAGTRSYKKIARSCAFYGWFWNKLKIRWKKKNGRLSLQLGTWTAYGKNEKGLHPKIRYHITMLWNDSVLTENE